MDQGFASICAKDPVPEHSIPAHVLPVYATSTFVYESPQKAMKIFRGEEEGYIYSRWRNPTVEAVERKLAALETYGLSNGKGEPLQAAALLFGSGMAAIHAVMSAILRQGDRILTHPNIYGTSTELFAGVFMEMGVDTVFMDLHDTVKVGAVLKSDKPIRVIFIESPNNPTISSYDLTALAGLAAEHGAITVVDGTFASPYLQQPLGFGIDFVVHSTTKYLNGHGTALGGAVVGTDLSFMNKEVWTRRKVLGGNSNPFDAWLLNNGIKTLPLRMERHSSNALEVARFLQKHPAVAGVNYPGLTDHPDHALAGRQMRHFGGILSFELKGGLEAGIRLMERVRFCVLTATVGTVDTLIQHPASMTHVQVPKEQQLAGGITEGLIRLSVGIEDVRDIINDLDQALAGGGD